MKVGDLFPVRQVRDKPCPRCGDKVFKTYPTGFVIESAVIVGQSKHGFTIRNDWHCPACGLWKPELAEVNTQGFRIPPRVESNSSDKSKSKRKYRQ